MSDLRNLTNTTDRTMENNVSNTDFQNQSGQGSLADKAKQTTGQASAEASSLANEAKAAVSDLGDRAKQGVTEAADHIRSLAEEQKAAGADRFKGYAGSINRAADSLDEELPMVANFARKAAGEIEHLADAVKDRDLADIVGVVHDYARRQPAIFLGATALAGFVVARFLSTSAQKRGDLASARTQPVSVNPQTQGYPRPAGYTPS